MNRAELKANAKQQIKGNIGILFAIALLAIAIIFAVNLIPIVGTLALALVISPALSLALITIYLNLTKGIKPQIADLFNQFNNFWSAFKATFFVGLFTMLWSLLLYIPGIIKALSYSMTMYILAEDPTKPALQAIRESKEMMHGHKADLFVLYLSFFGWFLLGYLTLGLLYIWLVPYMETTLANFYNSIKPQYVSDAPSYSAAYEE